MTKQKILIQQGLIYDVVNKDTYMGDLQGGYEFE